MTGTFIDTIIICTLTGLTIIVSGVWTGTTNGAEMTQSAFATTYGSLAPFILTISLTLFAFTTIIGWNYYASGAGNTSSVQRPSSSTVSATSPSWPLPYSSSSKPSGPWLIS